MTPLDISVVVSTHNRPAQLRRLLEALARQEFPRDRFEVVVVDDGGDVPARPVVDGFSNRFQRKFLEQVNRGPAAGRNLGIAGARGRFLAFTDDDCLPAPDWLLKLVEALERHPGCLLGGRIVNGCGDAPCSAAAQVIVDCVYRYYNRDPLDARFFASNNMACSAAQLRALGGFDASFQIASEDRNLCERWRQAGGRLVSVPQAVVTHVHRLDLWSFLRMHFRYGRGAARFHRIRSLTGSSRLGEHFGFHRELKRWLLRPFEEASGGPAIKLAALLVLWQLANAAGFLYEFVFHGRALSPGAEMAVMNPARPGTDP